MRDNEDNATDKLVRNERRGIWLALAVVLALASTLVMGSDTRRALLTATAIAIVFAVIWLAQSRTRIARQRDRDVVTHDELRQAALRMRTGGPFSSCSPLWRDSVCRVPWWRLTCQRRCWRR